MKVTSLLRRKSSVCIGAAITLGIIALPAPALAEDDPFYKLMFSYSRSMGFAFEATAGPRGRVFSGEGAMVEFIFDAGATGFTAGRDSLRPGQCTWLDRAMKDNEPRKVKLYKPGVKAFRIRNTRNGEYFLLTGPTRERNGRESYHIIYSMPVEEGTLFTLDAQRAAEHYRGFTLPHDHFNARNISTVSYVRVPAR